MARASYELAQVNIARMRAPLDTPLMSGFVDQLEPVNAVADAAEGFVWRLQTEDGDATAYRVFDDEWLMVNMSVWTSPQTLTAYVYGPEHRAVLRGRRQWFHQLSQAVTALWWVEAGHRPTVSEAEEKLTLLRDNGPTAEAFTLRTTFPPPGSSSREPVERDLIGCEAD
ncbi:MAG: DUF3291 domain-containing protein [Stackebrandtia sp.]